MKAIEKVKRTPELIAYYKRVGVFLKNNPKIKSRKLALGYEVNIGTIPNELVEEWINIVNNK